jgi:hypothetical protein
VFQRLGPLWVGQGGWVLLLIAALGSVVLRYSDVSRGRIASALNALLVVVGLSVFAELFLTTWYLFAPGYMDHIEASVASDAHYFRAGVPLYPPTDAYTFHGLLYGPLLAESNSLGYLISAGAFSAKVIGWLAAWIAIAVIVASSRLKAGGWSGLLGIAYASCLLVSFGGELTTDRSESLLLLCAALAMVVAQSWRGVTGLFVLGVLSGAASAFKLHGPVYCVPALYLWCARYPRERWRQNYLALGAAFAAAAGTAAALPFLPANVSLDLYREYLGLALKHGASLRLFLMNSAFLLGIWAPLGVLTGNFAAARALQAESRWFALVLFGTECLVVVIASKPGAGVHHLLPFLAAHAYLFQRLYVDLKSSPVDAAGMDSRAAVAIAATLVAMILPTAHTAGALLEFDLQSREQARQRDELLLFSLRYPGGMLGVAGHESYALANFRPWLTLHGALQTDYGAFMDLRLSGLDDTPLQEAFGRCDIPFVYMPKPGAPFMLPSGYGGLLFSDELRSRFHASYSLAAEGKYFDVFACETPQHRTVRSGASTSAKSCVKASSSSSDSANCPLSFR